MKAVPLNGERSAGRVALVDEADYDLVTRHSPWHVLEFTPRRGRRVAGPYAITAIRKTDGRRTTVLMHTLITGWRLVDHEDHNGLNNQRANLRPATCSQNLANSRGVLGSTSTYKGVSRAAGRHKWRAAIMVRGVKRELGHFADEEEAALAYNAAALEAFGEFAFLNEVQTAT
jgi:hypothetical protein